MCGRFSVRGLATNEALDHLVPGAPVVRINGAAIARGFPMSLVAPEALTLTGRSRRGDTTSIGYRYDPGRADLGFLTTEDSLTVSYQVRLSDQLTDPVLQTLVIRLRGTAAMPAIGSDRPSPASPEALASGPLNQANGTGGTVIAHDGGLRFCPSPQRQAAAGQGDRPPPPVAPVCWPGGVLWWPLPVVWLWTLAPRRR